MSFDLINGAFEFLGAIACWANVRSLWRDGTVKGIDWRASLFFTVWGWWNLLWYSHIAAPWSWWGALVLVLGNTAWVMLYLAFKWGLYVWRIKRAASEWWKSWDRGTDYEGS